MSLKKAYPKRSHRQSCHCFHYLMCLETWCPAHAWLAHQMLLDTISPIMTLYFVAMSNMTVLWICAAPLAEICRFQTISRQNKDPYALPCRQGRCTGQSWRGSALRESPQISHTLALGQTAQICRWPHLTLLRWQRETTSTYATISQSQKISALTDLLGHRGLYAFLVIALDLASQACLSIHWEVWAGCSEACISEKRKSPPSKKECKKARSIALQAIGFVYRSVSFWRFRA